MYIRKKIEKKKSNKKLLYKIVLMFFLIGFLFFDLSFAQNTGSSGFSYLAKFGDFFLSLLSRGWILFASLAGKLMTNNLIYGGFMNLDTFLWKMRNIMKNFANYALGFLFIYTILKSIISKEGASNVIKKNIIGFFIAGVLIQASRFLFGALIDLSTIAITTVSAIPGQIISSDFGLQKNIFKTSASAGVDMGSINGAIQSGWIITFDPNKNPNESKISFITTERVGLEKPISQENYLDMILPSYNSVAGPLIFLGTSIFKFQDYGAMEVNLQLINEGGLRTRFMDFLINGLIVIMYSLALFFLVIINFFRIFFLRIIIMFSPIIIFIRAITKFGGIKVPELGESAKEIINIGNIITLIFKPVLFVAFLSIIMIFTISIKSIINPEITGGTKIGTIEMTSKEISPGKKNSTISSDGLFNFSLKGAKHGIADLIVFFFTIFSMRLLIKISATKGSGIKFIDKKMTAITGKIGNLAGELPFIPIGKGVGFNSVFGDKYGSLKNKLSQSGLNLGQRRKESNERNVSEILGVKIPRGNKQKETLKEIIINKKNNPIEFRNKSARIAQEIEGGLSINNNERKTLIEERYKIPLNKTANIGKENGKDIRFIDNRDNLDKRLEHPINKEIIHNLMRPGGNPLGDKKLDSQIYGRNEDGSEQ